ncbi:MULTISPECIES: ABC transporter ATP-binding protein [Haloferax]|uniref:ABC-type D-xylose/L-arabinose transporter n=2 Tax=Haloferax TaxID=2251 RepID=A0A6G1Z6L5_9EURY|nr:MULTISPECIES: ABC transporter ATP-binding protein [Haloferax]KAB1185414.1 ABC transporter ATP-binding protein [Haloferax sp. CBA1149]MRW82058.1 ATP-binding cassette domain-containing protein [Haloferax marinisediminis]
MSAEDSPSPDSGSVELGGAGEPIRLERVRKEFGELTAVKDVSLEIQSGEFLVLLGPSGCGKTTTLRMIAGLETPTDGEIYIGDDEVTRMLPQKRELSMVFQSYALYPHKTVRENLAFPLKKMDLSSDERTRRIERAAEILEISDLLEKQPGQLSGGQRQRVALGRTIIREPRAFLMDEPLSNLDAKLRVHTRTELRELQQNLGTTTVYVTHDQEEAMSVADRIAILNDGEIQQVGSPEEIYQNPENEFVAGFLGEPAMNFFDVSQTPEGVEILGDDPVRLKGPIPAPTERIGIRPEHVAVASQHSAEQARTSAFTANLLVIEPLGNAYELELERGGVQFTARVRSLPDEVRTAETVDVFFEADSLNTFDEDGVSLTTAGGETDG